ncbi:hypothetical protein [Micromonospora inositola]|uniref:Uncharacterized protein n=1 Tax=Micromonospora inositola TaxID=47865 RepID=A0A1C5IPK2_9ACTN|nr:hypothetical protein [Micromonospora inositola]SCG60245.1 hypothetical protein GA0070613_3217 [Micromonospora inositola]
MTIYPTDDRVRYSPSLHVWTVDTREHHSASASTILAAMLAYAAESGDMPDGCTCAPESFSYNGASGMQTSGALVHPIFRQGAVVIVGHGTATEHGPAQEQANASQCPLADAEGERQARDMAQAGQMDELWTLTEPFPIKPGILEPAPAGSKAPRVWTGEPLSVRGVGTIPDRHVHAATRADLTRLAGMAEHADRLASEAHAARTAAMEGPATVRRLASEAAMAGKALDTEEVSRLGRDLQEAADTAEAVAAGTRDAVEKVQHEVAAGIAERRDEYVTYLRDQAAHGLARLDAAIGELDATIADLMEIDRVRQTVDDPGAGRLFSAGSFLAGNAVEAARETRERAAATLAPLERAAAKVAKAKASQSA